MFADHQCITVILLMSNEMYRGRCTGINPFDTPTMAPNFNIWYCCQAPTRWHLILTAAVCRQ